MDAGARDVEVAPDERRHRRDAVADLVLEVVGDLGDDRRVHAVERAAQRRVLEHHRLERDVARALADAQQRAVDRACTVEPRGRGIDDRLVKVVVPVPLEALARHVGILLQAVDDAGHAARQRRLRVGDAVAHGVARADLDRDARLARELLQLVDKRYDKAVKIGARDVLEVAARDDAGLKRVGHGGEVVVHGLTAGHLHFLEDVVVAAADEDARLADAEVAHEAKVLLRRADPRRDLRELQPQLHALFERLAVFLAVDEKLRLPDDAVRPAEPRQVLINIDDLVDRVRLHGLLPVAQGRVRDPDLLGHVHRHAPVVERHLRHRALRVNVALEVRLRHVLERIFIRILLQQIRLSGYFKHGSGAPFCCFVLLYTIIHTIVPLSTRKCSQFSACFPGGCWYNTKSFKIELFFGR